jgi:ubiquinone/menaquinone biosynthesis C-methylase UbiE
VACGAGRNALYLAERGFDVDAVDISGEAIHRARDAGRRLGLSVNWLEHDLDKLPHLEADYQLILVIRFKFTCQTSGYISGPEGYLLFYTIGPDKTGICP